MSLKENPLQGALKAGVSSDRNLPPIAVVNDFGNGLSPAECQLSIANGFDGHDIPNGRRSQLITVRDVIPFNVVDGAFQIRQLAHNRHGRETVFVGVVDPGVGTSRRGVVIQTEEGHSFVGPDNGLFSLAIDGQKVTDAYAIRRDFFDHVAPTFHGRDVFAPLAAEIAAGVDLATVPALERIDPEELIRLDLTDGHVVHHDGYPNTKLWKTGVPVDSEGRRATAVTVTPERRVWDRGLPRRSLTIPVTRTFEDVDVGEWLVYEGSSGRNGNGGAGHVEIAVREGSGKNGSASRLRTPVGGVVGLEWHFDGQISGKVRS